MADDGLSLSAAASDVPDAPALHYGDRCFTFGELAALACERVATLAVENGAAIPLVGSNTLDTLLQLYALLERRIAALLLHPRLTEREREIEIEAASQHDLGAVADAAAILYTSGTTGRPRGAVLTRRALLASAHASEANLGWNDDDCWLAAMPIGRIGGLSIITRCLAARRTVALEPGFEATTLPQRLEQTRATLLSLVPTALAKLLEANPRWRPPARLRAVLIGGAAAPRGLLRAARERGVPIITTYGCTETCSQVVATPYPRRFEESPGAGRPLAGAEIRIESGRIQVRGPMCMAGYLGEAPLGPGEWFDTGDVGAIDDDGFVHVSARRSDLIVTGGDNVYPAEVERVLEQCAGVAQAGVFGVADPLWGHQIAAALVPTAAPPGDDALATFIRKNLAPYKRPRHVCFVAELPHTADGKLDRPALQSLTPALRAFNPG